MHLCLRIIYLNAFVLLMDLWLMIIYQVVLSQKGRKILEIWIFYFINTILNALIHFIIYDFTRLDIILNFKF